MSSTLPAAASDPTGLSRRNLLRLSALMACGTALPLGLATTAGATTDPYAALRTAWSDYLSGGAIDQSNPVYSAALANLTSQARTFLSTLQTGSGRTALWPDLPLGSVSGNITGSLDRLRTLALAYVTPGTGYTGSSSLSATITSGLDFLATGAYAPAVKPYNNWWDWQIGSAQALTDTGVLMYSQLTTAQITNYCASIDAFVPDPTKQMIVSGGSTTSTGANRLDECRAVIIRGILGSNSAKITTGVADISPALPYVTAGDGLYSDGSYTQHNGVAYTGTYGAIFFGDIVALVAVLQGSSWAFTDPNLADEFAGVANAFIPVVYNGLMLDSVRGRAISRYNESDATDGFSAALNVLNWANATSDGNQAAQWRSVAKGWLQRNTVTTIASATAGVSAIALAETVLGDSTIVAASEPVVHHQFPSMARAVHRRPGWAYSISMCSQNIVRYEVINNENLHGWYTGDGMGQLYLDSDVAQFNDAYWDTVDPYQLPGVTADAGTLVNSAGAGTKPATTWVGGSVVGGVYGAVGMQLKAQSTNLTAVKSWFCLDNAVVALGAGITSTSGNHVLTTVENRNLHTIGANTLSINGTTQSTGAGWSSTVSGVHHASVSGVGGYYFLWPAGANNIQFALTDQTGNWTAVNAGAPTNLPNDTRPYLSIAFDHGVNPKGATYSYVLLPNATEAQTAAYAANPSVSVIVNSATAQAIADTALGVTMANFWAAGTAGPITATAPASVSMQAAGGTLTVAVSDPTRASSTVQVTITASGYPTIVSIDPAVTVLSNSGGTIKLQIATGGTNGASHSVTLSA